MLTIPFRSRHLTELEFGVEERTQHASDGSDIFSALSHWDGPALSLVGDHGRVLGCLGLLVHGRTGVLWAVLSDEARANRFGLHRTVKRHLAQVERVIPLDRMLAAVRAGFGPGRHWLEHLGFIHDNDFELGNDRYEGYVKWLLRQQ